MFSKLVKVVTRAKAKFSINRWLHLYFLLKLHNIQNEHFSVLKKCKKYFKFNGNVLLFRKQRLKSPPITYTREIMTLRLFPIQDGHLPDEVWDVDAAIYRKMLL